MLEKLMPGFTYLEMSNMLKKIYFYPVNYSQEEVRNKMHEYYWYNI